jgi:hypothetical protein
MHATPPGDFHPIIYQDMSLTTGSSESSRVKNSTPFQYTNKRKIPIKIILNDDEEVVSQENNSETTDENSLYHFFPNSNYFVALQEKSKYINKK